MTPDKGVYRRCEIHFLFKIFLFRLTFSNILKTHLHSTSVAVTSSALNQCRCLWTSKSGHGLKSLSDSTHTGLKEKAAGLLKLHPSKSHLIHMIQMVTFAEF